MQVTVRDIRAFKDRGERFAMLTAYDAHSARLLDQAGIPLILVGDTLAMVMLGHDSTLPVTVDEMLHHTRAVVRGRSNAMVVGDMPFMSYQVDAETALRNAARLVQEGGAQAVKLEGGLQVVPLLAGDPLVQRQQIAVVGLGELAVVDVDLVLLELLAGRLLDVVGEPVPRQPRPQARPRRPPAAAPTGTGRRGRARASVLWTRGG